MVGKEDVQPNDASLAVVVAVLAVGLGEACVLMVCVKAIAHVAGDELQREPLP